MDFNCFHLSSVDVSFASCESQQYRKEFIQPTYPITDHVVMDILYTRSITDFAFDWLPSFIWLVRFRHEE